MNEDLINRKALMEEFSEFIRASNNSDFAPAPTWNDAVSLVASMPSVQPTLYGYRIEHLALIAMVMQKENVTPEKAVECFNDIKRIGRMIVDEQKERILSAMDNLIEQWRNNHETH